MDHSPPLPPFLGLGIAPGIKDYPLHAPIPCRVKIYIFTPNKGFIRKVLGVIYRESSRATCGVAERGGQEGAAVTGGSSAPRQEVVGAPGGILGCRGGEGVQRSAPPARHIRYTGQEVGGGSPISERARGIGTRSGCTPLMAAPRWHPLLLPLLALLAAPVAAGDPAVARNDRTVAALLGLLLCLALGLALAWHHLCRLSAGRYHPRPLGRRALQLLRGQWHRLRSPGDPGDSHGDSHGEVAVRDEDEELMPWNLERRPQQQQEEEEDEQEEDEKEEEDEAEAAPEGGESPLSEGQAAGGSAEALLSDLHAFSGTAAWGDARPHVTAL
ncbi:protein tyrosine phosphatase receptor type C-associated protein [Melozone crissalis]|uniref:protein tyrosine phosphatase receptor type C-associated protein n=1 Tax=Melozone crissalis TaxID=40204 RepID=UPI0023DC697D|nr:protein tyrosine phosphatase receptor type C-associated protein [Melozone crissalis]